MSERQSRKHCNDYYYDPSSRTYRPGEGPGRYYLPGDPGCSYYCDTPIDRPHRFRAESVDDDAGSVSGRSSVDADDSASQQRRSSRTDEAEDQRQAKQRRRSVSVPGPRSPNPSPPSARADHSITRRGRGHGSSPTRAQRRRYVDLNQGERRFQNPPSHYHMNDPSSTYRAPDQENEIRNPRPYKSGRSQTDGSEPNASRRGTRERERKRNTGGGRGSGSVERRRRVRAEHPILTWLSGRSEWR